MTTKIKNELPEEIVETLNGDEEGASDSFPSAMEPEIISFRIVGLSPLLQNNPEKFIGVPDKEPGLTGKKKYDDKEEAELRVYKDKDGNFIQLAESFLRSMKEAAKGRKFGKQFATRLVQGSVFLAEPNCLILDGKGKRAKKYIINKRPVVVNKARILRCRPEWHPWEVDLALEIDSVLIGREQVKELLSLAGRIVGVGDYRPQKGGGYGRFFVK